MLTASFVAVRIVANPISNVFQKQLTQRSADPMLVIGITHALLTVVCLPFLAWSSIAAPTAFWIDMTVAALLAFAGNVFLVHALRSADLSVVGPINAYKSVISLALGIFLIGEIPTAMGVIGIALVLAGSLLIVDRDTGQSRRSALTRFFLDRGVQFRIAALVCSATEAVFLKRALLASTPLTTFLFWSILGLPIGIVAIALVQTGPLAPQINVLRNNWATYLWLAITTGLMQSATLFTFGQLQVGYSLALFQLSAVVSVLLGYRYFQEPNFRKRLLGSAFMVAGAALIVTYGHPR